MDVSIATILGGIIGFEREWQHKPAGLRTNMIIAGASALIVSLGRVVILDFSHLVSDEALGIDPTRILHAVILGVGFIGAGTILKRRNNTRVRFLTTAATIWMSSALGMAVALKEYYLSIGVTIIMLIINHVVGYFNKYIDDHDLPDQN